MILQLMLTMNQKLITPQGITLQIPEKWLTFLLACLKGVNVLSQSLNVETHLQKEAIFEIPVNEKCLNRIKLLLCFFNLVNKENFE